MTIHMRFNKSKCWILQLRWGSPGYMYRVGDKRLKSSSAERLGILFDSKLNTSQQCTLAAKRAKPTLEFIRPSLMSEGRDCPALLCTVQPHLKHWIQFGATISEGQTAMREHAKEGLQRW